VSNPTRNSKNEITRPGHQEQPKQVRKVLLEYATKTRKIEITQAARRKHLEQVRGLFLEYAQSLCFSLCFQSFDKELAELPGIYAPPDGRLLLATINGQPAGCAALHKLDGDICEMKRLYVRPQFRGLGLGRQLTEQIIADARNIGYKKMRLDTIAGRMDHAIGLYRQLGFKEIDPYRPNPISGALYMEFEL
jgi:ribosomal protein S18 acetylase RimI-like enzyme